MNLVLIYNALKYEMEILVGQVLILSFSIFFFNINVNKIYQVEFQENRLGTCILLATLIFEMSTEVKVE